LDLVKVEHTATNEGYPRNHPVEAQLSWFLSEPSAILNRANLGDFFSRVVLLPQVASIYDGCLTCIPSLYSAHQASSPLTPALSALLLTFISRTKKQRNEVPEAINNYGNALQLTRKIVSEGAVARGNEVILTIIILSMYEVGFISAS
jgi:hypothetical protein